MEGLRQRGPRWAPQGLDETGALPEEPGPLQVCLLSGISPALDTHAPCPPSPSTAWGAPACRERSHGGLRTPCLSCCRCSGQAAGPHWSPGDPSPRLHSCSLRVSQGLSQDSEPTSAGSWALSHGLERETDPPPGDRASTRDPASERGGATVPRRTPRARGWGWRTEGRRLRPHPRHSGSRGARPGSHRPGQGQSTARGPAASRPGGPGGCRGRRRAGWLRGSAVQEMERGSAELGASRERGVRRQQEAGTALHGKLQVGQAQPPPP